MKILGKSTTRYPINTETQIEGSMSKKLTKSSDTNYKRRIKEYIHEENSDERRPN